jgi:hypothetical protein
MSKWDPIETHVSHQTAAGWHWDGLHFYNTKEEATDALDHFLKSSARKNSPYEAKVVKKGTPDAPEYRLYYRVKPHSD